MFDNVVSGSGLVHSMFSMLLWLTFGALYVVQCFVVLRLLHLIFDNVVSGSALAHTMFSMLFWFAFGTFYVVRAFLCCVCCILCSAMLFLARAVFDVVAKLWILLV